MIDFDIQRRLYLVCYDIADDEQRHHVHRIVATFANGGQKSAYECYLSIGEKNTLSGLVSRYVEELDSLVIQPIIHPRNILTLGIAQKPINHSFTILE